MQHATTTARLMRVFGILPAVIVLLLISGCDAILFGPVGNGAVCTKHHCGWDYARFGGNLPIPISQNIGVVVSVCEDGQCSEDTLDADVGAFDVGDRTVLMSECPNGYEGICGDEEHWYLGVRVSFIAEDDPAPSSVQITVTNVADRAVLLAKNFQISPDQYKVADPTQCDEDPDNITCLQFKAKWELP